MSDAIQAIVMPKWGLSMKEGMVARWLVEEGAAVATGDDILDIETSKIANVYQSPVAGPLRRIVVAEGETVPVGALLGVVAEPAVADAEVEAFVARFQESFAVQVEEAADTGPEPATIEVGGRLMRYLDVGEGAGPPILFLHGFGGDLNNWQFNQEGLAENYRTLALDLPGHGGSTKDLSSGHLHVGAFSNAVLEFMDAMGIGAAHLVGHSLGGAIAIDMALNHAERVASVTAICSAGLGPEINMDYVDGVMQARRQKQMRPVLELLVADPAMISREMVEDMLRFRRLDGVDQALNRIIDDTFAGGRQALELEGRLGELTVPLQVIWGREDRIIPVSHADGLPDHIPVHVVDGAGHMPHMEQSAEVDELIRRFVAG
jgi:pyruvate dehydrogenase E2 component (dihydrolipoamide acetyltransferase)